MVPVDPVPEVTNATICNRHSGGRLRRGVGVDGYDGAVGSTFVGRNEYARGRTVALTRTDPGRTNFANWPSAKPKKVGLLLVSTRPKLVTPEPGFQSASGVQGVAMIVAPRAAASCLSRVRRQSLTR